jgi:hypothetical protein
MCWCVICFQQVSERSKPHLTYQRFALLEIQTMAVQVLLLFAVIIPRCGRGPAEHVSTSLRQSARTHETSRETVTRLSWNFKEFKLNLSSRFNFVWNRTKVTVTLHITWPTCDSARILINVCRRENVSNKGCREKCNRRRMSNTLIPPVW